MDQEAAFRSEKLREFADKWGITLSHSGVSCHHQNGVAEAANRFLKQHLEHFAFTGEKNWPDWLGFLSSKKNMNWSPILQSSPYELVFGMQALNVLLEDFGDESEVVSLDIRQRAWNYTQQRKFNWFCKAGWDRKVKVAVSDSVWWLNPERPGRKYHKEAEPYEVLELVGQNRLKVRSVEHDTGKEISREDVKVSTEF